MQPQCALEFAGALKLCAHTPKTSYWRNCVPSRMRVVRGIHPTSPGPCRVVIREIKPIDRREHCNKIPAIRVDPRCSREVRQDRDSAGNGRTGDRRASGSRGADRSRALCCIARFRGDACVGRRNRAHGPREASRPRCLERTRRCRFWPARDTRRRCRPTDRRKLRRSSRVGNPLFRIRPRPLRSHPGHRFAGPDRSAAAATRSRAACGAARDRSPGGGAVQSARRTHVRTGSRDERPRRALSQRHERQCDLHERGIPAHLPAEGGSHGERLVAGRSSGRPRPHGGRLG